MARVLAQEGSRLLFTEARTNQYFINKAVSESTLKELYELSKWGPTAVNCCPMRTVFVKSESAKAKLLPVTAEGNRPKVAAAPVTAILAWDSEYFEKIPHLMPHMADYGNVIKASPDRGAASGEQSATLQAAYFFLAARSVGLDVGPMGGFDRQGVDKAFFEGESGPRKHWKSFLLVNLGYGDSTKVFPRAPRLTFDDANIIE